MLSHSSTPPRLSERTSTAAGQEASSPTILRHLEQGAELMMADMDPAEVLRIVDGCLCLALPLADGRHQILDILGPGRLIGAPVSGIRGCRATALAPTRLSAVDLGAERHAIVEALRQMLWRAQSHAALLGRTATERVAVALLDLAAQFAIPSRPSSASQMTVLLHLTRTDLADWLGLTLSTVSRCLHAFRHHGLIAFEDPRIITIRNRDTLEALAAHISLSDYRSPRLSRRIDQVMPTDPSRRRRMLKRNDEVGAQL